MSINTYRVVAASCVLALVASTAAGQSDSGFDHGRFDSLLAAHVTREGLVDYDAFAGSPDFRAYLDALATAAVAELSDDERLALWINAYNAYTIELINRHEERDSIRNINKSFGLFQGKGPWEERLAEIGGATYTLDEIEHEIIRPRFGEPRIHFALVCAALGCPRLRREAYTGARLDAQLDDQARVFLRDEPGKNRIDTAQRRVYLSPIFDWYRDDFPAGREGLGRYLARFIAGGDERSLLESGNFELLFTEYDWQLNKTEPGGVRAAERLDRLPEAEIGDRLPPGWELRAVRGVEAPESVVTDATGSAVIERAIRFEALDQAAFFGLELRQPLDPRVDELHWTWRVDAAIDHAELRAPPLDDAAARVFVVFGRGGLLARPEVLFYSWSGVDPVGDYWTSALRDEVRVMVLRNAESPRRTWLSEARDLAADYRLVFGGEAEPVTGVGFMIDTDATGSRAVALLGGLRAVAKH